MAAWSGLAGAALMVIGGAAGNAGGPPPSPAAPAPQIADHFAAYDAPTLISAYANLLAAVALLWFAAGLWRVIRAAGHQAAAGWNVVGLLGAATTTVTILSVSAVQLALPLAADTSQSPDTVQVLLALWYPWVSLVGVAAAPLLVGFGVAALRARVIPVWLTWVGFVGAAAGLIGAFPVAAFVADPTVRGLVALVSFLQYPALFLWLLAASISMLKRRQTARPDAVRTSPANVSS